LPIRTLLVEDAFTALQNGEEKGFAHFFHLHYRSLNFFAGRLLKDEALAEDVVAESFLKLFEKRATVQSEATLKSFLYTTVRNACLDKLEHLKVKAKHQKETAYLSKPTERSMEDELIRTETLSIVLKAMEELPPATRKVFQLHYIEGKSYDEISKQLNRSKETIRKQKQQGLLFLKRKLLLILIVVLASMYSHLSELQVALFQCRTFLVFATSSETLQLKVIAKVPH